MGLPDEAFYVPDDVLELYRAAGERGPRRPRGVGEAARRLRRRPRRARRHASAATGLPGWADAAAHLGRRARRSPPAWPAARCSRPSPTSSRPSLAGGADLTVATPAPCSKGHGVQSADEPGGRQIYFGVREHAMAAAMNGMALHGGVLPVGGTFLVFSDYCRPSVRLAALSRGQGHLLVHPRLGRRRRGRAHPPAGRARRRAARHPGPARHPAGRRQRDRRGLAPRRRARRPHRAHPRRGRTCRCSRAPPASSLASGAHVLRAAEDPDVVLVATGSEVHVARRRRRAARRRGRPRPGRRRCRAGSCSTSSPTTCRTRSSRPRCPPCPSRPACRSAGTAGPTTASPSTASARRPRATGCWPSSGSPPSTWPSGPGALLRDLEELE